MPLAAEPFLRFDLGDWRRGVPSRSPPPLRCRRSPSGTGSLASTRVKPHIVGMVTETKKKLRSRRSDASKQAVLYRGVRIIPKTGKRSPIAKVIRDGLRTESERSRGETARA